MVLITEPEFSLICSGIREDRDTIIRHNPLGTPDEILLWMLLSCLISYLSLSEQESPSFTGKPDTETYRNSIMFVLKDRRIGDFDVESHLQRLLAE